MSIVWRRQALFFTRRLDVVYQTPQTLFSTRFAFSLQRGAISTEGQVIRGAGPASSSFCIRRRVARAEAGRIPSLTDVPVISMGRFRGMSAHRILERAFARARGAWLWDRRGVARHRHCAGVSDERGDGRLFGPRHGSERRIHRVRRACPAASAVAVVVTSGCEPDGRGRTPVIFDYIGKTRVIMRIRRIAGRTFALPFDVTGT